MVTRRDQHFAALSAPALCTDTQKVVDFVDARGTILTRSVGTIVNVDVTVGPLPAGITFAQIPSAVQYTLASRPARLIITKSRRVLAAISGPSRQTLAERGRQSFYTNASVETEVRHADRTRFPFAPVADPTLVTDAFDVGQCRCGFVVARNEPIAAGQLGTGYLLLAEFASELTRDCRTIAKKIVELVVTRGVVLTWIRVALVDFFGAQLAFPPVVTRARAIFSRRTRLARTVQACCAVKQARI